MAEPYQRGVGEGQRGAGARLKVGARPRLDPVHGRAGVAAGGHADRQGAGDLAVLAVEVGAPALRRLTRHPQGPVGRRLLRLGVVALAVADHPEPALGRVQPRRPACGVARVAELRLEGEQRQIFAGDVHRGDHRAQLAAVPADGDDLQQQPEGGTQRLKGATRLLTRRLRHVTGPRLPLEVGGHGLGVHREVLGVEREQPLAELAGLGDLRTRGQRAEIGERVAPGQGDEQISGRFHQITLSRPNDQLSEHQGGAQCVGPRGPRVRVLRSKTA